MRGAPEEDADGASTSQQLSQGSDVQRIPEHGSRASARHAGISFAARPMRKCTRLLRSHRCEAIPMAGVRHSVALRVLESDACRDAMIVLLERQVEAAA